MMLLSWFLIACDIDGAGGKRSGNKNPNSSLNNEIRAVEEEVLICGKKKIWEEEGFVLLQL